MIDLIDILEEYKAGYLDAQNQLELFAYLIRMGRVWNLEKPYPQTARRLIDAGYITPDGEITKKAWVLILKEGEKVPPAILTGDSRR
jgi:hypothetical protein